MMNYEIALESQFIALRIVADHLNYEASPPYEARGNNQLICIDICFSGAINR